MKKIEEYKSKFNDYVIDHPVLKFFISNGFILIGTIISAFIMAYYYRAFVSPTATIATPMINDGAFSGNFAINHYNLVGGGVTGLGQVIILFFDKLGINYGITHDTFQSILYFSINVPLFILAFLKIGKKFAIFSAINVLLTSMFITIIPESWTMIFDIQNDLLCRAIFAGVLNGLGITIAVELGHTTGGTDIVSSYFSLKKGIGIGKYVMIINTSIVLAYTILSSITTPYLEGVHGAATMALYTLIFFFVSSFFVDHLTTRNKKVQLQIVTDNTDIAKVLINQFPHGCTIVDAKGAFYNHDKKIIYTVISSFELNKATALIYKIDPHAFVTVNNTFRVYGKFFLRPIQ